VNSFLIEIGGFDDQGDEHPASANVLPRAATLCHDLGREYGPVILQLNCKRVDISLPVLEPWVPTRGYPGASPLLSTISKQRFFCLRDVDPVQCSARNATPGGGRRNAPEANC